MRPRIGVTATDYSGGGYRTPQIMVGSPFVEAVERAGASSVLLTPAHDPASLDSLMSLCDGLLLTGGEDVDPARFGQEPHPRLDEVCVARDAMELDVLATALRRRIPVLAVCRGIQLLNVALGGTLYQDLPSQRAGPVVHEQDAPIDDRWHAVHVEDGSRLEEIAGTPDLFVNSFHHQGLDRVAEELRPVAWTDDGLVEAVEATGYPWVIGVQWHPERVDPDAPYEPDVRLFREFVRVAEGR